MELEHANLPAEEQETSVSEPLLAVQDVQFAYPEGHQVLKGVSLVVEPGSCLCLMGVNGCGKSTLIDCVLGENRISAGQIMLSGQDAQAMKPAARARLVAYVPQVHDRTFPYPVEHVVLMGCVARSGGLTGPGNAEDHAQVTAALEACGIAHLAERPYTSLSGGEMQMVMLARALVQDTPLIVMDEPTAHLDFHNELLFLEMVERLVLEQGVSVLMATHSPNQAFHLARSGVPTRVALMHEGRILRAGAPRKVLDTDALAEVFGVQGLIAELDLPESERLVRQVVALHTL